jgi:hypothetical protein
VTLRTLTGYGEPRQQATRARPRAIEQPQTIWQTCKITKWLNHDRTTFNRHTTDDTLWPRNTLFPNKTTQSTTDAKHRIHKTNKVPDKNAPKTGHNDTQTNNRKEREQQLYKIGKQPQTKHLETDRKWSSKPRENGP